MSEPQLVEKEGFAVAGISVRTINRDEFNPDTAKLASFWTKFRMENIPVQITDSSVNSPIYGVYSQYESDALGYYTVTAGVEVIANKALAEFTTVEVPSGQYLVFSAKGAMPDIVITTWQRIWTYFANEPAYKRTFKADFELYPSSDEVDIYIGVSTK